jgi:opacity protein-like surface antigen
MRGRAWAAILAALIASPALAVDGGGALVLGAPRGALGEQAAVAGGMAGHLLLATRSGALGLRLDGSWLLYGSETVRLPVAGTAGRIAREVTTDNWVAQLGVGPQIVLPLRGARPYLHGFAGLSYLSTESRLRDPSGFASRTSTNYDDTGFAYGGGGGVVIPLPDHGVSLDLGVRYVRTSSVRFLAEGDLAPDDSGRVRPAPHRGPANVLEFRLGLVFSDYSHSPRH